MFRKIIVLAITAGMAVLGLAAQAQAASHAGRAVPVAAHLTHPIRPAAPLRASCTRFRADARFTVVCRARGGKPPYKWTIPVPGLPANCAYKVKSTGGRRQDLLIITCPRWPSPPARMIYFVRLRDSSAPAKKLLSALPGAPGQQDIVGFGSDTIQDVFDQFSLDYNASVSAVAPHLETFDATNPQTGTVHDPVTAKLGCAPAPRPNGSSEGILASAGGPLALTANTQSSNKKAFCTDFARSSRARAAGDPPAGPGGIQFLPIGLDAVTYATNAVTNAPANLTTAQLASIYTCSITNWMQVGGTNAPINPQLPQTGSGTRKFFLTALGGGVPITPGPCVDARPGESPNNLPEENEGVSKYLQGPDVIYPYSIGKYIAQVFHSAKCLNTKCTPVGGVVCVPKAGQNLFGCNVHGRMKLRSINGTNPTVGTGTRTTINPAFSPAFVRLVFVVVRWTAATPANVPAYLQAIFGPKGWICASKAARSDLVDYGFRPIGPACR